MSRNPIKALFSRHTSGNPRRILRAGYDLARTTADNARHWSAADNLSADSKAAPEVRRRLRSRSRYEIANNSYAKGLVQMLANDTIGTGPRLQVLLEDESQNDAIERAFADWADAVHLARKLRLMRIARCQDGEAFAILITNPAIPTPVKLDLRLIEADRVCSALAADEAPDEIDGIRYDDCGNPVEYRVLRKHPGSLAFSSPDDVLIIPADNMLHIFRPDRPEQHRGVPELTAALPLFAQLRRYNLAALSSAEAAADFSAILYTDSPPNGETDAIEPMDCVPLERNMMLTMPAGWKMSQLESKQPTANHCDFVRIILSEIARCAVSTYGAVSGDYSGYNYASGRLDNQLYRKTVLVDRAFWESEVLNVIFAKWFREYAPAHHSNGSTAPHHMWFWDGFGHVDPTKEAEAQRIRLENHTTTIAAECARDGLDYMSVLRQRAKELRILRQLSGEPLGEPGGKGNAHEDDGDNDDA